MAKKKLLNPKDIKSKPIKRLPVGKEMVTLNFPFKPDPKLTEKYEGRKVTLIDKKKFRNPGKVTFENTHLGSLKT